MSRHYALDFDGTLYNTGELWNKWARDLAILGISADHALDIAEPLFHDGFTLALHASALGIHGPAQEQLISQFQAWVKEQGGTLVYEDVLSFLGNNLASTILTHGETGFQHFKITTAGLDPHIGTVRIAGPEYRKAKHLEEMLVSEKHPIVFIDDNPQELLNVLDAGLPVELVRMRREGARHAVLDHHLDDQAWRVIRSLDELETF